MTPRQAKEIVAVLKKQGRADLAKLFSTQVVAVGQILASDSKAAFIDIDDMNKQLARELPKGFAIFDLTANPTVKIRGFGSETTFPCTIESPDGKHKIKAEIVLWIGGVEDDGFGVTWRVTGRVPGEAWDS